MVSRRTRFLTMLPWVVALLIAALPLFAHLSALPVRLWDESRLAFNALEMARGESHILVPTYGGVPDLWNVKPPLLIWIQALAICLLGEGELAVRLPSAIAALATCVLLMRFAEKRLSRPWLGVLAVGVLVTAKGYVSLHGVRTGDYDGLMTLFTTGYGLAWFLFAEKGDRRMLWTVAACIAGAVLTKGVAGLLPLPALLLYSIVRGRIFRHLRSLHVWVALVAVAAVVAAYYGGREVINPGYLDAVRENELGGRFSKTIENHAAPRNWYLGNLLGYRFRPWMLWWAVGLVGGFFSRDALLKRLTIFSAFFCGVHLAVISAASTKLEWYDLPVYPFAALTSATGVYLLATAILRLAARRFPASPSNALSPYHLITLSLIALYFLPYRTILDRVFNHRLNHWDPPFETDASAYLQSLHRGDSRARARLDAYVWKDYYANLAWYRALGREGGKVTEPWPVDSLWPANPASEDSLKPALHVFTFQPEMQQQLVERYKADTLDRHKGVVVYAIRGRR